jgi:hypothetical protein
MPAIFSNGEAASLMSRVVSLWRGVECGAMEADLQTKVEKYEGKAAKCKEWAEQAKEGPQRAMYEVLAGYYGDLATDFRQVIAKRTVA